MPGRFFVYRRLLFLLAMLSLAVAYRRIVECKMHLRSTAAP